MYNVHEQWAYQSMPKTIYNRIIKHIIGKLNEPLLNKTLLLHYFAFRGTRHKTSVMGIQYIWYMMYAVYMRSYFHLVQFPSLTGWWVWNKRLSINWQTLRNKDGNIPSLVPLLCFISKSFGFDCHQRMNQLNDAIQSLWSNEMSFDCGVHSSVGFTILLRIG